MNVQRGYPHFASPARIPNNRERRNNRHRSTCRSAETLYRFGVHVSLRREASGESSQLARKSVSRWHRHPSDLHCMFRHTIWPMGHAQGPLSRIGYGAVDEKSARGSTVCVASQSSQPPCTQETRKNHRHQNTYDTYHVHHFALCQRLTSDQISSHTERKSKTLAPHTCLEPRHKQARMATWACDLKWRNNNSMLTLVQKWE